MELEKSMEFIKKDLLPEAVHDRCFCEPGSREFVEFVSVEIAAFEGSTEKEGGATEYYRSRLIVNFSNEPKTFAIVIKLLNEEVNDKRKKDYDKFLNEEMFYNKMTKKYKLDIHPRCYLADMGRYGRPVIVLEDLEACGYVRVDGKLDEDHLALCLKAIAGLHERGLRLKAEDFNSFREFDAKLIDVRSDTRSTNAFTETSSRISKVLEKLLSERKKEMDSEKENNLNSICHGNFISRKCCFFKYENKKPMEVRTVGWNKMRYCSIVVDLTYLLEDRVSNNDELERYLRLYISDVYK